MIRVNLGQTRIQNPFLRLIIAVIVLCLIPIILILGILAIVFFLIFKPKLKFFQNRSGMFSGPFKMNQEEPEFQEYEEVKSEKPKLN